MRLTLLALFCCAACDGRIEMGPTAGGNAPAGGSAAGGSTAGGDTAGGSTAGGDTAGGSTAGGNTAGGATAGGGTAGGGSITVGPDVTTLRVFSTGAAVQTDVPVTWSQVFAAGDVADTVTARDESGATVPLQVDVKARHADGSLRHAVLSAKLPSLPAAGLSTLTLARATGAAVGPALALTQLLATPFDAEVRLTQGGRTYVSSVRALLQAGAPPTWLSGPLVTEWVVGGPVRDATGAHPHLAVYFHVRAYAGLGRVRVDAVVENGWSFVPGPSTQTYDVTLSVAGQTRYTQAALTHYHHARWHRVEWWGAAPAVNPQHDKAYLTRARVLPRYLPLTPTAAQLAGLPTSVAPMQNGSLEDYMPTGGPSASIGPLPAWATAWALSDDDRARRSTLANADAGGAYSVHFRNDAPGKPSSGLQVSIEDHPRAGTYLADFPAATGSSPYTADVAHQPSVAFAAYLISGDLFYLDELLFWVHFNWLNGDETSIGCRGLEQGLLSCHQERGQAWALRELGRAAFIVPDAHPLKGLYQRTLANNRAWYAQTYLGNGPSANPFGAIDRSLLGTQSGRQETKTWMDDFFTWSVGHLIELGFADWRPMLDYKAKFVLGRLNGPDFCWVLAGSDTVALSATYDGAWRPSWSAVYLGSFPSSITGTACGSAAMAAALSAENPGYTYQAGEMFNYASLAGSRLAIMHSAASVLVDNQVPGALAAWQRVRGSTVQPDFSEYQNFALQPR